MHVELHVTEVDPDDKSSIAISGDDDWSHDDWVFEDRVSVGFLVQSKSCYMFRPSFFD